MVRRLVHNDKCGLAKNRARDEEFPHFAGAWQRRLKDAFGIRAEPRKTGQNLPANFFIFRENFGKYRFAFRFS